MIASSRGILGTRRMLIALLSWLGIFFGVTWIVALVLACVLPGDGCTCCGGCGDLDKLATASKLYKDKAITKSEFEEIKAKILSGQKKD